MSETLQTIKERRSIRNFKDEQVKEQDLQAVLEAGLYAPSAMNEQSWHFTVIQNTELLKKFTQIAKNTFAKSDVEHFKSLSKNDNYKVFYNAPTAIVISGNVNALNTEADTAAATENMLLAAKALGLGSCWIGSMPFIFENAQNEDFKKELGIPEGYNPINSIALGYAANENAKAPARRENTINIIK
ncbi:nitroreductase family protein [Clostridium pasteurianum]|uniref:nitroreductase family protein n=1 Tax=Clostridium pasteurianum TaxID=1501 RepID=UPI002260CB31|nr:nitroreductase family protein [Clostridium pasteurianum]UZW14891.1 nitroreductase family protein [Clostridium pasteurianum]